MYPLSEPNGRLPAWQTGPGERSSERRNSGISPAMIGSGTGGSGADVAEVHHAANRAIRCTLSVDYPDRQLNRLTTFFRIFVAIPILIVLGAVAGGTWQWGSDEPLDRRSPSASAACCSSHRC